MTAHRSDRGRAIGRTEVLGLVGLFAAGAVLVLPHAAAWALPGHEFGRQVGASLFAAAIAVAMLFAAGVTLVHGGDRT